MAEPFHQLASLHDEAATAIEIALHPKQERERPEHADIADPQLAAPPQKPFAGFDAGCSRRRADQDGVGEQPQRPRLFAVDARAPRMAKHPLACFLHAHCAAAVAVYRPGDPPRSHEASVVV